MGYRRNPIVRVGRQPDLFQPEDTDVLADIPMEEIGERYTSKDITKQLKRDDFPQDTWDELDDDTREAIYESDEKSKARIDKFAEYFIERWKWNADENWDLARLEEDVGDYLHEVIGDVSATDAKKALSRDGWDFDELFQPFLDRGLPKADIMDAFGDAIQNQENFEFTKGDAYTGAYQKVCAGEDQIEFDGKELAELAEDMPPDEIERALEKVNTETDWRFEIDEVNRAMVGTDHNRYIQRYYDNSDQCLCADPNQESVLAQMREALLGGAAETVALPTDSLEDRILLKYKDGGFAVRLLPSEFPEEGRRMQHCVGKPVQGYIGRAKAGEIWIVSIRSKKNTPELTIEVELDEHGKPMGIGQLQARSNHPPDKDQAIKAIKLVKKLGLEPMEVPSLQKYVMALPEGELENPFCNPRVHCAFCQRPVR